MLGIVENSNINITFATSNMWCLNQVHIDVLNIHIGIINLLIYNDSGMQIEHR